MNIIYKINKKKKLFSNMPRILAINHISHIQRKQKKNNNKIILYKLNNKNTGGWKKNYS